MTPQNAVDPTLSLEEVTDPRILARIYRLRVEAWRTKLDLAADVTEWRDSFESDARHWAFFDGERPVAAARLTISRTLADVPDAAVYEGILPAALPGPIASLTRLVVHPQYRGRGLARPLDEVRIAAAEAARCSCVIGATHEPRRVLQLQAQGFEVFAPRSSYESGIVAGTLPNAIIVLRLPHSSLGSKP